MMNIFSGNLTCATVRGEGCIIKNILKRWNASSVVGVRGYYKGYPGFKPQEYDIYNCRVCNTSFPSTAEVPEEIYENIYDNGKDK